MPKVKAGYFDQKREMILDAAYAVCMKKPLHEVKMKDIIAASGVSQGGIYRYYDNLEDIILALLNRYSPTMDVDEEVDSILALEKNPEEIACRILALYFFINIDSLQGYGKIYYELTASILTDPALGERFQSLVGIASGSKQLQRRAFAYMQEQTQNGYFRPKMELQDLFSFLLTSMDGIERDVIITTCYDMDGRAPKLNVDSLFQCLCISFTTLLGGDISLCPQSLDELRKERAINE